MTMKLEDINQLESSLTKIKCESETDFYGLSFILNKYFNNHVPRPIKAHSFKHGWTANRITKFDKQIIMNGEKDKSHICFNNYQKNILEKNNFSSIKACGAPYLYANELIKNKKPPRISNSYLIMPAHTLAHIGGDVNSNSFFQKAVQIAKSDQFSTIAACLHRESINSQVINLLNSMKVCLIKGAQYNRSLTLIEQATMYSQYEYVITNSLGSHILYALFSGCKVKIIDLFYFNMNDLMKHEWYVQNLEIANANLKGAMEFFNLYPEFNKDWILPSEVRDCVLEEIGFEEFQNVLTNPINYDLFTSNPYRIIKWCLKNKKQYEYISQFIDQIL